MGWWRRWRADLARPESPTSGRELGFLTLSAAAIIGLAQLSDPGSPADLLLLVPAFAAFLLRGLRPPDAGRGVRRPRAGAGGAGRGRGRRPGGRVLPGRDDGALHVVAPRLGHPGRADRRGGGRRRRWWWRTWLAPEAGINWTPWAVANVFTFALGRLLGRQQALIEQLERPGRRWPNRPWPRSGAASPGSCTTWPATPWPPCCSTSPAPGTCCAATSTRPSGRCATPRTVGRSSLDQIRATVAALRTDERGTDPALAGSADLAELVEEYRRAGLVIDARRRRRRRRRPRRARSAPPCTASPARRWPTWPATPRRTRSSSPSTSSTARSACWSSTAAGPGAAPDPGAGHFGLVGMRERARALGGELDGGPDARRLAGRRPPPGLARPGRGPARSAGPGMIRVLHRRRPGGRPGRRGPHPRARRRVRGGGRVRRRRRGRGGGRRPPARRRAHGRAHAAGRRRDRHPPPPRGRRADRARRCWSSPRSTTTTCCGARSTPGPPGSCSRTPRPRTSSPPPGPWPAARPGSTPRWPRGCSRRSGAGTCGPALAEAARVDELTEREHDVLRHMARGATNTEIAPALYRQRGDGEDPRGVDLRQARRARPGRGHRVRLRPRDRRTPPRDGVQASARGPMRPRGRGAHAWGHAHQHRAHRPRRPRSAPPATDGRSSQVRGLEKRYGATAVLHGVSFAVRGGELFGLLGTNGAGKTTTVEILQGLRRADGGSVAVLGLDPGRAGDRLRRRIGAQLQDAALPDRMRVGRGAAPVRLAPPRPPARSTSWPTSGSSAALRRRPFAALSGGERQRLFVALALVGRPQVVFLDELTQNLDPVGRRQTWDVVRRDPRRGTTVVLVTHDVEEAERLCDRVVVSHRGRVVAEGTPASIVDGARRRAPRSRFTDADLDVRPLRSPARRRPRSSATGPRSRSRHRTGAGPRRRPPGRRSAGPPPTSASTAPRSRTASSPSPRRTPS